jgi:hypothetical protein
MIHDRHPHPSFLAARPARAVASMRRVIVRGVWGCECRNAVDIRQLYTGDGGTIMGVFGDTYDFGERWLGRAHLVHWLIGGGTISSIFAAMSGWWVHITGGSWPGIIFAAIGAFVVVFAVVMTLIAFARWLIAQRRTSRVGIRVILGQDAPFHTYRQHLHHRDHLIKIGVANDFQDKSLTNCEITLQSITGLLSNKCPVPIKSGFMLNPGATTYIDLVELREPLSGPPFSAPGAGIRAYFPINPLPSDKSSWIDDPPNTLMLMATAAESPPHRIECRLLLDDKVLKLEPAGSLAQVRDTCRVRVT